MTSEQLLAFAGFAFVSSITPGPNNLMLMASGTNFGFARTVPHLLGVTVGFTVMVLLVGRGLAQLFHAIPIAHTALQMPCAVYLVYLAWKIATASPPKLGEAAVKPFSFARAALFQWVNPKAWTMALTAVTGYAPTADSTPGLVPIAVLFGLINLPSVGIWTLMGVQLRRLLSSPRYLRLFNVTTALALIATLYPLFFGAQE